MNIGVGVPYGILANVLDYDIVISKFELKLHYSVHDQIDTLWKSRNILRFTNNGLDSIPIVLLERKLWQ